MRHPMSFRERWLDVWICYGNAGDVKKM